MANNPTKLRVKLKHGIIVQGATEPKGTDQTYGKIGDVVDLDIWTGRHLINCDMAEEVQNKSGSKA